MRNACFGAFAHATRRITQQAPILPDQPGLLQTAITRAVGRQLAAGYTKLYSYVRKLAKIFSITDEDFNANLLEMISGTVNVTGIANYFATYQNAAVFSLFYGDTPLPWEMQYFTVANVYSGVDLIDTEVYNLP